MFLYPAETAPEINCIQENSIVDVCDMVAVNDELWIYVQKYVTPDPHNVKGWIRLTDTVPYTEEKQPSVQTYVEVAGGTPVYETHDFSQVPHMSPVLSHHREQGRLHSEQNGYVSIDIPGGKTIIVEKKYLIYPEVLD